MSLLAEIQERHHRFHAEINRRASLLAPKKLPQVHFVPNVPFGIPKKRYLETIEVNAWERCMWFYDLVNGSTIPSACQNQIDRIVKIVARSYCMSPTEMLADRRSATVVRARQLAMYLAKKITLRSYPEIGRRMGGRDHSTIHYAVHKIERLLKSDAALAFEIDELKQAISA